MRGYQNWLGALVALIIVLVVIFYVIVPLINHGTHH